MISVREQQKRLHEGVVQECEIFEATIARIKKDEHYKAWRWLYDSYEQASEGRWKSSKMPRSLSGLMLGVKDIFNSQTGLTEMGSSSWGGHVAGNDARLLGEFTYKGATMVGKTETAEFAVHHLPPTLNPWNKALTPGTSSSGSAVAVALGHVPVALATQTAGSITRPASFTGTIGFKPTQGIYPRTGILKTCDPFDTVGFICSHLEDVRYIFEQTRVRGQNYPLGERALSDAVKKYEEIDKLTIARITTPFSSAEDELVSNKVDQFIDGLPNEKFNIVELDLRSVLHDADIIHKDIYNKALSYYFQIERSEGAEFSPIMQEIFLQGDEVSGQVYRARLEALPKLRANFQEIANQADLILTASTATTAPIRGEAEKPDTSRFWTMLHLPTLSLPLFLDEQNVLPFGLQVVGTKKFNEAALFRFISDASIDQSSLKTYRAELNKNG